MVYPAKRGIGTVLALLLCTACRMPVIRNVPPGDAIVAVLDYEDLSQRRDMGAESVGLTELVASELVRTPGIRVVERRRILTLLEEMRIGTMGWQDASTAQRVGRLLGANLVVLGAITQFGPDIVVTTRLVKVETGEIVFGINNRLGREPDPAALGAQIANSIRAALEPAD